MIVKLLLIAAVVAGCADNPPAIYPTSAHLDESQLALGPGDKLELTIFYGARDNKATYTLDASGQMNVQYIGVVSALGKTAPVVQAEIQKRLIDGFIIDPIVSLTVVEINSLKCAVLGQVIRSGSIRYTPGMTITEAIAEVGGFAPMARKNLVKVTRFTSGKSEIYMIPVEMIAEGKRPNFPMMPGDEVFVPERPW